MRCILHPQHMDTHVCSKTPAFVNHNVMFLVDTTKLGDPGDLESDDLGVWHNNRVDTVHFRVKVDEEEVTEVVRSPAFGTINRNTYALKRVYRTHGTDRTFRKISASVIGKDTTYNCGLHLEHVHVHQYHISCCYIFPMHSSHWQTSPHLSDYLQI